MKRIKKFLWPVIAIVVILLFLVWLSSVVKCEILTIQYSDQFKELHMEYTMFRSPKRIKIINYTDISAEVYYVSPGVGGDVVRYERTNRDSEWSFVEWETIWSSSGSADGFIWPYIR